MNEFKKEAKSHTIPAQTGMGSNTETKPQKYNVGPKNSLKDVATSENTK